MYNDLPYHKRPDYILKKKEYDKKYRSQEHVKAKARLFMTSEDQKKKRRIRDKKRYHNDKLYKLRSCIKANMLTQLKNGGYTKKSRMNKILGYSYEELIIHLESQFKEGMTWDNHGEWHIDHIIPLMAANNNDQFMKLWNYENLQPLWASENLAKRNEDSLLTFKI